MPNGIEWFSIIRNDSKFVFYSIIIFEINSSLRRIRANSLFVIVLDIKKNSWISIVLHWKEIEGVSTIT